MLTIEEFTNMVDSNLMKLTDVLIEKMEDLKSIHYADEVKALFIIGGMSGTTLSLDMTTREDMFNEIDPDDVENGFAGSIDLIEEFIFDEWENDEFMGVYEENDLEDLAIGHIAGWVQHCFDQSKGESFLLPIYFAIHDEDYVLDLKSGEWIDPEELE